MQFKEIILLFSSYKHLAQYIAKGSGEYDLLLYIILITQISFLPSIPSGFHSPNVDGWIGFFITVVFSLVFYSIFYYCFYYKKSTSFIKEIVIISVVSRFHSFICLACVAVIQTGIWAHFNLPKPGKISLVYYLLYYALFSLLMIFVKRKSIVFGKSQ